MPSFRDIVILQYSIANIMLKHLWANLNKIVEKYAGIKNESKILIHKIISKHFNWISISMLNILSLTNRSRSLRTVHTLDYKLYVNIMLNIFNLYSLRTILKVFLKVLLVIGIKFLLNNNTIVQSSIFEACIAYLLSFRQVVFVFTFLYRLAHFL